MSDIIKELEWEHQYGSVWEASGLDGVYYRIHDKEEKTYYIEVRGKEGDNEIYTWPKFGSMKEAKEYVQKEHWKHVFDVCQQLTEIIDGADHLVAVAMVKAKAREISGEDRSE